MSLLGVPLGRKQKEKLTFTITIHHLTKIPKNSVLLYVGWKRGRKNQGETQRTLVKDKTAVWEQDFVIKSTIFKEGEKYKKKFIYFYVQEVQKESKSIFKGLKLLGKKDYLAKISVNLSDFAPKGKDKETITQTHTCSFWNGTSELKITIKAQKRISENTDSAQTTDTDASIEEDEDDDEEEEKKTNQRDDEVFPEDLPTDKLKKINEESKEISKEAPKNSSKEENSKNEENTNDDTEKILPLRQVGRGFDKKVISPRTDKDRPKIQRRNNSNIDNVVINVIPPKSLIPEKDEEKPEIKEIKREENKQIVEEKLRRDSLNMQDAITKISSQEKELEILNEKLRQKERENRERVLIDLMIVTTEMQFNKGVPVNAPILFKAIEIWECFGVKKNLFPSKVTKAIRQLIEKNGQPIKILSFWLSNLCVFLNLIAQEFPVSNELNSSKIKVPYARVIKEEDLFGDYRLHFLNGSKSGRKDLTEEEFKYESPVSQFKGDIHKLLCLTFSNILMTVYQQISPFVVQSMFDDYVIIEDKKQKCTVHNILKVLTQYSQLLSSNGVCFEIINQFFSQIYYFINAMVFNSLITQKKYCNMGYSIYLKMSLTQLENWAIDNKFDLPKSQLESIREVTNVLMMNKNLLLDETVRKDICPSLSSTQIGQLLTQYHPDEYDPEGSVPSNVISALKGDKKAETIDEYLIYEPTVKSIIDMPSWRLVDIPKSLVGNDQFDFLFGTKK